MASVRPQNVRRIHMSSLKIDSSFSEEIVEKKIKHETGSKHLPGDVFSLSLFTNTYPIREYNAYALRSN